MAQKELAGQKVDENKNWFSALIESFDPGGVVDRFEKRDGRSRGCVLIEIRDTSAPS
jgi:hypothetical protein